MTYPDDVLKAAREAAAQAHVGAGLGGMASSFLSGVFDDTTDVQSACIAVMAERERWKAWVNTNNELGLIDERAAYTTFSPSENKR